MKKKTIAIILTLVAIVIILLIIWFSTLAKAEKIFKKKLRQKAYMY